jgi:hypothetical protein
MSIETPSNSKMDKKFPNKIVTSFQHAQSQDTIKFALLGSIPLNCHFKQNDEMIFCMTTNNTCIFYDHTHTHTHNSHQFRSQFKHATHNQTKQNKTRFKHVL